jgi:ABC-type uncharacterized transport system permease subunit
MNDNRMPLQFGLRELLCAVIAAAVFVGVFRVHPVFMAATVMACVLSLPEKWSMASGVCFLLVLIPLGVCFIAVTART